ncbi:hypothetical protein J2S07_003493 [Robertmurraya andreesenii]|uniref:Uncharacterized protein n=1 Tax=Anoxybacillus andreesenii TaxID=1325932 RepID=A0ABT9V875_9BACL|nr:hypothetical protein [Robertmurraya andreesenii]
MTEVSESGVSCWETPSQEACRTYLQESYANIGASLALEG